DRRQRARAAEPPRRDRHPVSDPKRKSSGTAGLCPAVSFWDHFPVSALFPPRAAPATLGRFSGWRGQGRALYPGSGEEPMSQVLMPKATAVWLVENRTLTVYQI